MIPSRRQPATLSFLAIILADPAVAAAAGLDPARGLDQVVTVTLRLNTDGTPAITTTPVAHVIAHSFSASELTYVVMALDADDEYRFEFDDSAVPRFFKNGIRIDPDPLIASLTALTGKGRQAQRQLQRAVTILNSVHYGLIAKQLIPMADCVLLRLIENGNFQLDKAIPEINLSTMCPSCREAADTHNPNLASYAPQTHLTMQFPGLLHGQTEAAAFLDRIVTAHCRVEIPKLYLTEAKRLAARATTLRDLLLTEKPSNNFDA